ncbi:SGNH/GDSL hydrolase family protein [Nocardioides sp. P5_C9_2]
MRSVRAPLVAAVTALAATTALLAVALVSVLRLQARATRRLIGKPLGESAPVVREVYKKKYGDPIDLLLLGDSIAAGLGAASPEETLGAQLARRLAKKTRRTVRLRSAAHVGSETSMIRAQLAALPPGYRADVAVIVVGGNDVTHRVRPAESVRHLHEVLEPLRAVGTEVVVGTCPDLGALGAVPQPLRTLASRSSRQLADAQRELVTAMGGHAVSLAQVVGPFFVSQPDDMFSVDRFHPSGAGYRRTAKAMLPSVLAALGHQHPLPSGHYAPAP